MLSLVKEGQLSKAIQVLDSAGMHALDEKIMETLRKKHPLGKELPKKREDETVGTAQFDAEEVKKAVTS